MAQKNREKTFRDMVGTSGGNIWFLLENDMD
jgi:hypothetical protein